MHNLHFILIKADSAAEAASDTENLMLDWGNENNWRCVGGIASEDGSDDIENNGDGRWGLCFLDAEAGLPREGTYFSRAVAYLKSEITESVTLTCEPFSTHPDLRSALGQLSDQLRAFNPEHGNSNDLWAISRNLQHLSELMDGRNVVKHGEEIPQFYEGRFDHFGLTNMTEQFDGARRYLVFLDMHS